MKMADFFVMVSIVSYFVTWCNLWGPVFVSHSEAGRVYKHCDVPRKALGLSDEQDTIDLFY